MLNRLKKYGVDLAGSIFNGDKGYDAESNFESLFDIRASKYQTEEMLRRVRRVRTEGRSQRDSTHQ
jgi:hypothetical protein